MAKKPSLLAAKGAGKTLCFTQAALAALRGMHGESQSGRWFHDAPRAARPVAASELPEISATFTVVSGKNSLIGLYTWASRRVKLRPISGVAKKTTNTIGCRERS